MCRARVGLVVSSCLFGALLAAPAADAQPGTAAPPGADRSNSQFTLRRDEAGSAEAEAARGRARAGDCPGALAAFDASLRTSIDPSVRRDRGLCHERLGHVFPAIDDYRAYLTARPEAPDADQIRQRLATLEGQAKTVETTGEKPRAERDRDRAEGGAEARASVSIGGEGASAQTSASASEPGAARAKDVDVVVARERLVDAAEESPLRYGKGFVLGPFVQVPRFWFGDQASSDLAYAVGGAFRYSFGPTVSIVSELGAAGIGTSGEATSRSGALLMGGIELRLPVSRYAGDHILLRGGVGYEHQVVSGTRAVTDNVLGRFGLGYRHVFGSSLALEAVADGGPAYVMPETGSARVNEVVGLSVAFLVGF
jgi:hypothetical protein